LLNSDQVTGASAGASSYKGTWNVGCRPGFLCSAMTFSILNGLVNWTNRRI
jgi:hypothetical protein